MQLIIDLLLLAVFAVLALIGWWRGFLKAIFSLGRLALSLILTVLFGSAFAGWLDRILVNPPVYEAIHRKFTELATEAANTAQGGVDALAQKIPRIFQGYLDLENLDPASDLYALADSWSLTVAGGISKVISTIIGYVLLFVIAFLALSIAIFILGKLVEQIRFIRTTDKILGLLLGILGGAAAVLILSSLLALILPMSGHEAVIETSFMLRLTAWFRNLVF